MTRPAAILLALIVLCVLVACAGGEWVVQAIAHLAFGWILNVGAAAPQVRVNVAGVALFALAVPLAAWLAHGTATWLWNDPARPWRWKWTWLGLAAVMLMFVAGVAATGVVHQAGWLIRSPVPLTESSYKRRFDAQVDRCLANVRQIAQALAAYAASNDGYVPADRADLVRVVAGQGGEPGWFVCGDPRFGKKPATQAAGWTEAVSRGDAHFTYRYFPVPIVGPDGRRRVRLSDREMHAYAGHHGLVVMYDDGHVELLDRRTAEGWLGEGFALQPEFPR